MKIFQFTPPSPLKVSEVQTQEALAATRKTGAKNSSAGSAPDFASVLKCAAEKDAALSGGPGGAVFQENRRAMQLPPQSELGLAGRLLNLLNSDIRRANPEALRNVHNLEGLIYVYNNADGRI